MVPALPCRGPRDRRRRRAPHQPRSVLITREELADQAFAAHDCAIDGWLASVGAEPQRRARAIGRAHGKFLIDGKVGGDAVRSVVAASWERSALAKVNPDADPPVVLAGDDLRVYRAAHPLNDVVPVLRDLVGGVADDSEHLMVICDAAGRLLWVEGHAGARRRAESMNFVEGAAWDETHAGTNAPGTALALDHEVQIFATEHFRHTVQHWTCAAAPIHDPATGKVIGVIDVTGGDGVAHPHSLGLVRAAARAAEAELAFRRSSNHLWVPSHRLPHWLEVLGVAEPVLHVDGRPVRLGRRHAEVLFLLATHPAGLTGDQLAHALYVDSPSETAVRVELNRLRQIVGDLVSSRPYRLSQPIGVDYVDVTEALRQGNLAEAVDRYRGPLLPLSEAPAINAQREWLEMQMRSTLLMEADAVTLHAWADRFAIDDLQVWEQLVVLADGPIAAIARARVTRLRQDYGIAQRVTSR